MKREQINRTSRFAGQVERYHTWPVHRKQSVGEHTWQVMRIWWMIWGPLSSGESTYLIWHDAGELLTGDLPFPMKANNLELKLTFDAYEAEAVEAMGGPLWADYKVLGTTLYRQRSKICDLLEMWEFGLVEQGMGNRYAEPIVKDTLKAARKLLKKMSGEDQKLVEAYVSKVAYTR